MSEYKKPFKIEYSEMLDFIKEQQDAALQKSDVLLSEKKELDYKKKQQEYMLEEQEKRRIPNISMFSPLNFEESSEDDVTRKDELKSIIEKQKEVEQALEKQKEICYSFERLKNFLIQIEKTEVSSNLIDYSTKLLETQEMDRNRISRDLHDSTVQSLTSLAHKMEYCSKLVDKDPVRVKLELQSMIELNKEIINGMREIIYDLRPMSLTNIGLVSTIESYCMHLRRNNSFNVMLKVEGKEQQLSSIVSVTLYRIIQEACNNAIRHSNADKITIVIVYHKEKIEIRIEDNGIGFDLKIIEEKKQNNVLNGFGLSTMNERARLLSGSLSIDSKLGRGTKVQVFVPIN